MVHFFNILYNSYNYRIYIACTSLPMYWFFPESCKTSADVEIHQRSLEGVAREKLFKVMTPEYLFSEESDYNDNGDFRHFIVRRLAWQKGTFKTLKEKSEAKHKDNLTPQHRGQFRNRRVLDIAPKRTAPDDCPKFIHREDED